MQGAKAIKLTTSTARPRSLTRLLLVCGLLGPLQFTLLYLVEGATRQGYDPMRNAVSALSLTDAGWVDIVSLVANGLLLIAFAIGIRRVLRCRGVGWRPLLLGACGLGFVVAGVFATDPAQGYPPGTPPGPAVVTTLYGAIHFAVGATLAFGGMVLAALAFAISFRRQGRLGWALYSSLTAIVIVVCFVGFADLGLNGGPAGLAERIAFVVGLGWVAMLSGTLLRANGDGGLSG